MGIYASRYLRTFNCFYLLLLVNKDKKKSYFFMLSSSVLILLLILFTGERDAAFRFFLVLIITLFIKNKLNKKSLIILISVEMILATYFKYYFVSRVLKTSLVNQTFIYNFLDTEFSAAGENLQVLLSNEWTKSFHGFYLIVIDFIDPFFLERCC